MSQIRWQKIEEIFQSALDLPNAERSNFIAVRCAGDEELRREVEKLLADYESDNSFIEPHGLTGSHFPNSAAKSNLTSRLEEEITPGLEEENTPNLNAETNHNPMIGRQIGAYRLSREIGRGGMGAVYAAERTDGSFRQMVAIKLIKRGMDTDFILKRFRQERQILATLNHPFIARLLDGGTTDNNLPYFVMEFIGGKPLYKYSDEKKLTISERLKLFRQVCEAIDFAHQNKVIHRDIKPPNILITNEGTPKLLDFGIAKVLNPELNVDTIDPTATAMRLMTPEYASPEQVCGGEITPASDIYSLGVLLYELLTGHRPYLFRNRAPHEIARVICEDEPMRPGDAVRREDNLLPTGASEAVTPLDVCSFRSAANTEDLQKELAGDIERVILKALRKEPLERYATASALADDIALYLDGKAVVAEKRFPNSAPTVRTIKNGEESLAVLPLKIFGASENADSEDEYLGIGLADALITRLSNVRRFVVRPTSSVLPYAVQKQTDAFAAGRELAVDFVVDGNIRRVGERIRVTVQLLSVGENSMRWAQAFDENFTDFLALEDSISERITKSLLPLLTGEEERRLKKRGTEQPQAHASFLRGRYYFNDFIEEGFARSPFTD